VASTKINCILFYWFGAKFKNKTQIRPYRAGAGQAAPMATRSELQRQDVCGLRIDICTDFDRSTINYGELREGFVQHCAATDASCMSTLVPRDAQGVTLVTTATDTFVLFPEASGDELFLARPAFSARHALGPDAVAHGWLYRNRRDRTLVALFDASRIDGVDLRARGAIERHTQVHDKTHALPASSSLHYHWCGYEEHCMRPFHHMKLGFDVWCIARLPPDLGAAGPHLTHVLPCLLVADGDLRPTQIVVRAPRCAAAPAGGRDRC